MKSLGIKRKDLYSGDGCYPCAIEPPTEEEKKKEENKICYPSLYIEPKFLAKMGFEEFEPGDRVKVEIEVIIREQTIRKNEKGKETTSQQLDLCASGTPEKAGTGEPTDEESDEESDEVTDTSLGYERKIKKPRKISPKEALGE